MPNVPVQLYFPETSLQDPPENSVLWIEGKTSQGYERKVYKKDGSVVIINKIPEDDNAYIASLLPGTENVSLEGGISKFIESFKEQRLAIIDFEGLFFYHYAQVTSSIKACYQQEAEKQKANLSTRPVQNLDQITKIEAHLEQELRRIDSLFKNFIDLKKDDINTIFKQAIETNIKEDGTIDVSSLNTKLNQKIKPLKNSLDEFLKDRLEEAGIIISPGKFRKTTNAFGENTIDITETRGEDGETFIEKIESTKITAHDKKHGPAVSKVNMIVKKTLGDDFEEKTIFEGYRTSHLVSNPVSWKDARYAKATVVVAGVLGGLILAGTFAFPPLGFALIGIAAGLMLKIKYDKDKKEQGNIDNTKEIIKTFMHNARQKLDQPLIYNLYASTHDAYSNMSISPTTFLKNFVSGFADDKDNQQTQRLKTLIDAQYEFNKEKDNIAQMFFTLNTPTNTFGREISLKAFPEIMYPKMHQVAQSNLIALAILLYGKDNEALQKLVTAYKGKNSSAFNKAYEILKQTTPDFSEANTQIDKAKQFLYDRFKEDSAAEHQYAKTSATCIGILAYATANLIAGCKSGNERTGGILGRIATFLTSTVELIELDSLYNKTRCNGAAVTAVSRIDQGSDPKTGTKTGGFLDQFNTNKTEAQDMSNIQTDSVSGLQAHKEKNKTFKAVDTSAFEKMYQKLLGSSEQLPEEIAAYFSYEEPKGAIYNSVNSTKLSLPSVEKGNVRDTRARSAFLQFIKEQNKSTEQIPVFENFSMEEFRGIQWSESLTIKLNSIDSNTLKTTCFNPSEVQKIIQFLQQKKESSLLDKLETKKIHTMESLFGKEGLKLFKEALQEEVNSQEFLDALVKHAVKPYYGTKPSGEFLIQILSGASGAGKSTSGNQALEREYQTPHPKEADSAEPTKPAPTYWMGWVDGGIPRELNQMQQVIKSFCIEHGVEVEDLYDHSKKILDPCKDKVLELVIAQNDPNLGLVIPETFSKDAFLEVYSAKTDAKKRIKQIKDLETSLQTHKRNTVKVSYDFVVGLNLRRHASVVKYMGDRRAFDDPETTAIKYDTFGQIKADSRLKKYKTKEALTVGFAEYKKYGPGGYIWGIKGSLAGFLQFHKAFKAEQLSMNFNCNDVDIYTSEGYLWNFNADNSGKEAIIASRRLVDDWLQKGSKTELKVYAAKNWKNYKNIMIPFKPGTLNFATAPDLEQIILANINKSSGLTKSEHNLEYLINILKILNDLQEGNKVNDLDSIKTALLEVYKLVDEKDSIPRWRWLDRFRSRNTYNVLVSTKNMLERRHELLAVQKRLDNSDAVSSELVTKASNNYDANYVNKLLSYIPVAEVSHEEIAKTDALNVKISIMLRPNPTYIQYLQALRWIHNQTDFSPELKIKYIKELKSMISTESMGSMLTRIANFFNPQEFDPALEMINEVLHHYEAIQQEEQIRRMDLQLVREKYVDLDLELYKQLRRNNKETPITAENDTTSHLSRTLSERKSQSLVTETDIKQFDTSGQKDTVLSGRAASGLKGRFLLLTFPGSKIGMDIEEKIKLTPKNIVLSEMSQPCKSRSGIKYNIKNSSGIISTTLSGVEVSGSSDMTLLLTIIDMIDNIRTKHQIIVLDTLNEKAITFAKDYVAFLKQKNDTISIQINGGINPHLSDNYSSAFQQLKPLLKTSENTSTLAEGEGESEGEHKRLNM